MPTLVTVETSARLHLGFLDLNGNAGRKFGSIGLALDQPRTRLSIRRSPMPEIEGPERDRVAVHLNLLCKHLGLAQDYRVVVEEAVPAHAGLGSGTQLALAVAAGVRRLDSLPLEIDSDSLLLQRGARSGIGAALLARATQVARDAGATRVWLITTNDNLRAIRFYERRGFRIIAVHRGAVDRARMLKPSIPLVAENGLELHDELERELILALGPDAQVSADAHCCDVPPTVR